jgi:hypothetical protein
MGECVRAAPSTEEWEKEFDRDWSYLNSELPKYSGRLDEIKSFIRTHYIPRSKITEVVEKLTALDNGDRMIYVSTALTIIKQEME